ncbi:hypothetical protein CFIMG_007979RA00001 [Ceratocystis fimbriata CBS 114723]|uniref:Uncharacterized protein n=1 Tax=Ceratocystis fimbriata CBS 114723 TaxID=1035309 RepID=A0A2C5X982_9PEZI|nr:hypothetical protein CFIMG_007979RA00001 [Ceratocystis fimbriata CBS 114723]
MGMYHSTTQSPHGCDRDQPPAKRSPRHLDRLDASAASDIKYMSHDGRMRWANSKWWLPDGRPASDGPHIWTVVVCITLADELMNIGCLRRQRSSGTGWKSFDAMAVPDPGLRDWSLYTDEKEKGTSLKDIHHKRIFDAHKNPWLSPADCRKIK